MNVLLSIEPLASNMSIFAFVLVKLWHDPIGKLTEEVV